MIYSKVRRQLVLTTLLICTWFALAVNTVYCMPRNSNKKPKGQQHMVGSVHNKSNPEVTPLTAASTYAPQIERLNQLESLGPMLVPRSESGSTLKIPLDGYRLKIEWVNLFPPTEDKATTFKVACINLTHPENYCPHVPLQDVMQISSQPARTDVSSGSTDIPSSKLCDLTLNDLCKRFNGVQISADSSEPKNYVIKGFTDKWTEIPINMYDQIVDVLACTPIRVLDLQTNQEIEDFEAQDVADATPVKILRTEEEIKDFVSQNKKNHTWDHKQNAYTKYPALGNPKDKDKRRFNEHLRRYFREKMEGDSIKLSSDSYIEVRTNSQNEVVSTGLFIQYEGIDPRYFLLGVQLALCNTFGMPRGLYIRL